MEHKITNDLYMDEACNEKRSIYVELVLALLAEGWAVKLCTDVADGLLLLVRQVLHL